MAVDTGAYMMWKEETPASFGYGCSNVMPARMLLNPVKVRLWVLGVF